MVLTSSRRIGLSGLRSVFRPRLNRAQARPKSSSTSTSSRVDRITSKLPRSLQRYTAGLRDAPVSHVVSFLILHELTAVVPLFALFGLFHYTSFAPTTYMTTHFGSYVDSGIARFERYFARKGWFGFGREADTLGEGPVGKDASGAEKAAHAEQVITRSAADDKYRMLVNVALAYAITKAALPIRIIGSVWVTPWFARILVRARGAFKTTGRFRSGRFTSGRFASRAAKADKAAERGS